MAAIYYPLMRVYGYLRDVHVHQPRFVVLWNLSGRDVEQNNSQSCQNIAHSNSTAGRSYRLRMMQRDLDVDDEQMKYHYVILTSARMV